ncbi:hypothetical protein GCK72_011733 [Caenorhabditis remanei]|uniref:Domain of unknown function WSN domain-containing protein n=1 Tax=Caenorhabditis remanei TaxID=31234 RepID=A0A6A5H8E0_CAERE|nr:hypothetical protein GCK72_011733 [Caenorhabditis remanei]KAF1763467.1 hypothetical protein GCK72_011733 [Caenorhabditis remanei]
MKLLIVVLFVFSALQLISAVIYCDDRGICAGSLKADEDTHPSVINVGHSTFRDRAEAESHLASRSKRSNESKTKPGGIRLKEGDVHPQSGILPDDPVGMKWGPIPAVWSGVSAGLYSSNPPLDKAKLAAETIIKIITRKLRDCEDISYQERALERISVELSTIREAVNSICDNNIVDQDYHERYNEVIEQVKKTKKYIEKLEELQLSDSSRDYEDFDRQYQDDAYNLKEQLNDLSMECKRALESNEDFEMLMKPMKTSTPVMHSSPSSPLQNLSHLQEVLGKSIAPTTTSTPAVYTSFISQNPSQLQEVLEEFCKDVIQFSKQQFKTLKLSNTDGSKAYALSRFLKIESDILNFQMKLALESLKSPDSELEKPIFGQIISEVSHSNQKIIEAHLDSMKRGIEKMTLLKSIGTSTASNFIPELAFWVLSFQNINEKLLSMGIEPIVGEDDNSFDHQKADEILRLLFGIRMYQSKNETIPSCPYEISRLLKNIDQLRVIDYNECIEKKEARKQLHELFKL